MLPPPCFTVGMVQCFLHAKEFNVCFIRQRILSKYTYLLANSKWAVTCFLLRNGFRLATLPRRPDWWSAAEMVVLLECSHNSTEELWSSVRVTIGFLVTSLTKALLPRLFGWAASSRKSVRGSKLLPVKNDGGQCFLGGLQCCKKNWYPSPYLCLNTILSRRSAVGPWDCI